ncbi:hypothetical protein GGX14DRAFT_579316 [Mycena pura]|uniref:Uncharacterized protein n=1 Tax=Mycena pura TaxID=153505 RepID=A0AAD6UN06_9AGAR|nr:hypothetical protein GGX14DRAFT_579316 [Mycena pura]
MALWNIVAQTHLELRITRQLLLPVHVVQDDGDGVARKVFYHSKRHPDFILNPGWEPLARTPPPGPNRRITESPNHQDAYQIAELPNWRFAEPPTQPPPVLPIADAPPDLFLSSRWHQACNQARDLCRQRRALETAPFSNAEP